MKLNFPMILSAGFLISSFASAGGVVRIGTTWTKAGHFYTPEGPVDVELRCVILAANLIPPKVGTPTNSLDALYPCIQTSKDGYGSTVNQPIPFNNSYEESSEAYTEDGLLAFVASCESEGYKKEIVTTKAGTFETCHVHVPLQDGGYMERWFGPVPQGNIRVQFFDKNGVLTLDEETTSYEW